LSRRSPLSRPAPRVAVLLPLSLALLVQGCSTVTDALTPNKVDYRSAGERNLPQLDVPPDLTQLARDTRYTVPGSVSSVSALGLQVAAPGATAPSANVALNRRGAQRIERSGAQRWLVSSQAPDALWPQLKSFVKAQGLNIALEDAELGLIETEWAENRARLPQDFMRRSLGKVFEGLFDSGERDRYRLRLERTGQGSEVFISHRGLAEVVTNARTESTQWQSRPSEPDLEAEMLARLLKHLAGEEPATATAAAASAPIANDVPARARVVADAPAATLRLDDGLDRAWRRVGLALDRTAFTVEDRDRPQGVYFVRYVDPKLAGLEDPGFFARVFGGEKAVDRRGTRYRIAVKADGENRSTVAVLRENGDPDNGEVAKRITDLLLGELR
jgi:outer membrane protein assembly factor BamC